MSFRLRQPVDGEFLCPLCTSEQFEQVLVVADDERYETGLYRCSGCGFAFVNPSRYTPHAAAEDTPPG
jgi:hypothetical protein